jgi:DNA polymerase elongation subunit (family B)
VGCLAIYYLLDAAVSEKEQGVKLTFYNPSKNKWKEIVDTDYRPYFFVPYPIPEDDLKVIEELGLGIRVVEKTDLFTRQPVKLTRVELKDFSDLLQLSRAFSKSWEKDVPIVSGYMYDNNLVFGAQYKIRDACAIHLQNSESLRVIKLPQKAHYDLFCYV